MEELKTRDQIDKKYKWAIEDLYKTDEDWEKEYKELEGKIEELAGFAGTLSDSAKRLEEYLKVNIEASKLMERVYVYAGQKSHEDLGNSKYQAMNGRAGSLMVKFGGANSFFEPEILAMDEKKLLGFIEESEILGRAKKVFTDLLDKKPHVLTKDMEELLASVGEIANGPGDIFGIFNNADLKFGEIIDEEGNKVELTHGRYNKFIKSADRRVRKEAFEAMYKAFGDYINTLSAIYGTSVKKDAFYAKARHYNSSLEKALSSNHIPVEVYDNLLKTVDANLDALHEYVAVKKKALRLDEVHMYDLYTPMVADVDYKIDFEEAKKMVKEALAPMGKAYTDILEEGYNNGWIDVYENKGKRSGAYSWGAYGTHPFVLLNQQDTLNSVFTLAHEMGHAIHSYHSDKTQDYIFAGYKIFVAEVASTCNESLLIHHLLKQNESEKNTAGGKAKRAYLLNYFLEQFRTTLFRQTMFAEFEKIAHEMVESGETLTAENLNDVYYKLNEKYFGKGAYIDKEIALEWSRIPHFYTAFYVYQYATGFSAAIALSKKILEDYEAAGEKFAGEETGAVKNYKKFLCGGSSKDPIDLLKMAGVDMSSKEPIEDAMKMFRELLDELKELL